MRSLFFSTALKLSPRAVADARDWRVRLRWSRAGLSTMKPMITHRFDLDHGVEAFELLRNRKGVKA